MKDKADNLRGKEKDELTQAYKSYSDHVFPNNETRHARCENSSDYVLCTPTNDECQLPNWKCVLRKCTACTYIALPGVEINSLNQEPMIVLKIYMNQYTCSHHSILIREKITTYLDVKEKSKNNCFYVKN